MNEKMRLTVNGEEMRIPRRMPGKLAAALACKQLQITDPDDLRLRRISGQTFVGDVAVIGDVLTDGDELELAPLA